MKKIFQAKMIITMETSHPFATHVAVEDDKIVGLGNSEIKELFPDFELDTSFTNYTILPGFIEGHAHMVAGQDGLAPYVGFFDRPSPEGKILKGLKSMDEVISYLHEEDKKLPEGQPLVGIGFDPIYFDTPRPTKADLDKVSTTRMVMLNHVSGHLITVNSKMVDAIPGDTLNTQGVAKGPDGKPSGELQEIGAMSIAFKLMGAEFAKFTDPKVLFPRYMKLAQMAGVTTITEMGVDIQLDDPKSVDLLLELTVNAPVRLMPMYFVPTTTKSPSEIPDYVKSLMTKNTDKLRFGHVKMMADGSIQGYTARLKQPYINGVVNGLWNQDPEKLTMYMKIFNDANLQVNCHCNGDEASEAFIQACKDALATHPWKGNRHTIQHGQMIDEAQFLEMKKLGMCANLFTNHLYYWGDQHVSKTIGLERAERMNAAGMARDLGVPYSMHCDASVTPISPLFNAWSAVNRVTATGKVLGDNLKISVEDAMYAITMGTAYLLRMEDEIGSIKVGKKADFVVLEKDPYSVDPMELKDIKVLGTVSSGQSYAL